MSSWNFCTSGAAIIAAGVNANTALIGNTTSMALLSTQIEGSINARTRRDWIASPPTANFTGVLAETAANMIAMKIITYDMSGFTSRSEASEMLNVLWDCASKNIEILKDDSYKEIMV